jgi:hypothetical protein
MKPAHLMAKFFKTCGDHFAAESEHHGVMAKGWDEASEQSKSHADRAEACSTMAEKCHSLADKCTKANSLADLEKLFGDGGDAIVPTQVSRVAPDKPGSVRMVARAGQPPIPVAAPDDIFEKIFGGTGTEE